MTETANAAQADLPAQLSAEEVARYLSENPDFFLEHDDLLLTLKLSHASGNAVSLLERQLEVLRNKHRDVNNRLHGLLKNANVNDRLFDDTRELVISLLGCTELEAFANILASTCKERFELEQATVILPGISPSSDCLLALNPESAEGVLAKFIRCENPVCGALREEESRQLFGTGEAMGSAAVMRLELADGKYGLLALGSSDPGRFGAAMATDFLTFIRDICQRLIDRLTVTP